MPPSSKDVDAGIVALRDLVLAVDSFRTATAELFDVGVRETQAISHLRAFGPMSHNELAKALRLTRGTVTALVDRLEQAGLVRRAPQPHDRRVVLVTLVGVPPLLETSHQLLTRCFEQVPDAADPRTIDVLHRLAGQLRANLPGRTGDQ